MLDLTNLRKVFNAGTVNEKVALNGIDLHLEDGDFVTVIGGNGAGKSTMLNAIAGVWPIDNGSIVSYDAHGYLSAHHERELPEAAVTMEDALATVSPALTVRSHQMAVIPSDGGEEAGPFITDGYSGFSRCTTMATMTRSFVVPLPLMGRIPAISGRYDAETGRFYAYTGAWDTEYDFYGDDFATTTVMYNDRGTVADENVKGGFRGEEIESYTQWYYLRMLAARILFIEANAITNLNGHSATKLPEFTAEERTFVNGEPAELRFELSGEAANTYTLDADGGKTPLYTAEYAIDGELPAGMTFDGENGVLSGTPTENGAYKITVSVLIDGWVSPDLVNDDRASINRFLRWTYLLEVNEDGVPGEGMDEEPEENVYVEASGSGEMMGSGEMSGEPSGETSGEASGEPS